MTTAIYEHTDIPEGMTCAEYRRRRAAARPASRRLRRIRRWRRRRG